MDLVNGDTKARFLPILESGLDGVSQAICCGATYRDLSADDGDGLADCKN